MTAIDTEAANGVVDHDSVRMQVMLDEVEHIETTWGSDKSTWPRGQRERHERLKTGLARMYASAVDHDRVIARQEKIEAIRSAAQANPDLVERGTFVAPERGISTRRSDPWSAGSGDDIIRMDTALGLSTRAQDAVELARGLTTEGRELLSTVVTKDDDPRASALVIAATSDAYRSAFDKVFADDQRGHLLWTNEEREAYARVEHARAALSLSVQGGGYLVPFTLDPTVMLTNSGTANPFRQISRIETTATNTWNGVTSTGVTAEWLAEGAEAADATPTFERVTVTPNKGAAWIVASFEVDEDAGTLSGSLPEMIFDAKDRLEATAFATGTDGVVTTISAVTGSRVSPTTGGALGVADVFKLWDALTPKARKSDRTAWLANNTIISKIRQFDTAGSASFWTDLGGATPPTLIGKPIHESSDMVATVTTGSVVMLAGDFHEFLIVDRLGVVVSPVGMVMGDNKRPTYQRGWAAHWRTAGKVTDTGALKVLKL